MVETFRYDTYTDTYERLFDGPSWPYGLPDISNDGTVTGADINYYVNFWSAGVYSGRGGAPVRVVSSACDGPRSNLSRCAVLQQPNNLVDATEQVFGPEHAEVA